MNLKGVPWGCHAGHTQADHSDPCEAQTKTDVVLRHENLHTHINCVKIGVHIPNSKMNQSVLPEGVAIFRVWGDCAWRPSWRVYTTSPADPGSWFEPT